VSNPVPFHLKALRGNPGKRALNKHEPAPSVMPSVPEPPSFLDDVAAAEWRRVAPELHALRLLTALDLNPLAAYCQAFARWRQAEEALATERVLIVTGSTGNAIQNPLIRVAAT
jgi:phage terminase small subunit